jgi:hypothetical protein
MAYDGIVPGKIFHLVSAARTEHDNGEVNQFEQLPSNYPYNQAHDFGLNTHRKFNRNASVELHCLHADSVSTNRDSTVVLLMQKSATSQ